MNRISDLSISNQLSTQDAINRARVGQLTIQESTKLKAQVNSEIAPQVQSLGKQLNVFARNTQHINNAEICQERVQGMEAQVNVIAKSFDAYRTRLTQVLDGSNPPDPTFNQFCQDTLQLVTNCLNRQDSGGRNLFGGQGIEGQVCDSTKLPNFTLGQPPSLLYAVGSDTSLQVDIDDNQTIPYGVTAHHPAFAEILQCLKIGATTVPDGNSTSPGMQLLRQCMTTADQATSNLGNVTNALGSSRIQLTSQMETLKKDNEFLQKNISEITVMSESDLLANFKEIMELRQSIDISLALVKSTMMPDSLVNLLRT